MNLQSCGARYVLISRGFEEGAGALRLGFPGRDADVGFSEVAGGRDAHAPVLRVAAGRRGDGLRQDAAATGSGVNGYCSLGIGLAGRDARATRGIDLGRDLI